MNTLVPYPPQISERLEVLYEKSAELFSGEQLVFIQQLLTLVYQINAESENSIERLWSEIYGYD